MSELMQVIVLVIFVLLLFFIFYGDPDVWDVAQQALIRALSDE